MRIAQCADEYVHLDRYGQPTPIGKMTAAYLRNVLPKHMQKFANMDGALRACNDTALALLAYKRQAERLGMPLPKGMPTDDQLFEAVAEDDAFQKQRGPVDGRGDRERAKANGNHAPRPNRPAAQGYDTYRGGPFRP